MLTRHGDRNDDTVVVVEAHDVVFAEIAPGLDFDHFERDLSRIFESIDATKRDKDRFVLAQQDRFVVACHASGAFDDHPMLGAVVMHAQ